MKTYLLRAGAYFLKMAVLVASIYGLMQLTGTAAYSVQELGSSSRGALLLAAIALLALVHPKIGFITRTVTLDMAARREEILQTMLVCGYELRDEGAGAMTFRADSFARRAMMTGFDAVTLTVDGHSITLAGPRKHVSKIEYRLNALN
jgi:hypothetical protein